jgi:hypothetical protein
VAHQILYDHIPRPGDTFQTFRVLWEPYTNQVALRFRNCKEAANGLVGSMEETIAYLDRRARAGHPWDSGAPREARRQLARISGDDVEDQSAANGPAQEAGE